PLTAVLLREAVSLGRVAPGVVLGEGLGDLLEQGGERVDENRVVLIGGGGDALPHARLPEGEDALHVGEQPRGPAGACLGLSWSFRLAGHARNLGPACSGCEELARGPARGAADRPRARRASARLVLEEEVGDGL